MRRLVGIAAILLLLVEALATAAGILLGPGVLHPLNLNPYRVEKTEAMLSRTGAMKEDFEVKAPDGVVLRGWKVRPSSPSGNWVLLFHGVSDNRTGMLGAAEFLLRHHFSLVMMDSRAHGKSGGEMDTYGWKERWDTAAIVNALYKTEQVRHVVAFGVSMGAAIAIQSAAVEPRIEAVAAEAPFASLREVSYDYASLKLSPLLGKTLLRPATYFALRAVAKDGGFDPDDVSPAKAVAQRAFPLLLICGGRDRTIPCRHVHQIRNAARDPGQIEIWEVERAAHAATLGTEPRQYEERVLRLFESVDSGGG
jgi:uncharacterized protein